MGYDSEAEEAKVVPGLMLRKNDFRMPPRQAKERSYGDEYERDDSDWGPEERYSDLPPSELAELLDQCQESSGSQENVQYLNAAENIPANRRRPKPERIDTTHAHSLQWQKAEDDATQWVWKKYCDVYYADPPDAKQFFRYCEENWPK